MEDRTQAAEALRLYLGKLAISWVRLRIALATDERSDAIDAAVDLRTTLATLEYLDSRLALPPDGVWGVILDEAKQCIERVPHQIRGLDRLEERLRRYGPHTESSIDRMSYLEIPAADAQRSAMFYRELLAWRVEQRSQDALWFRSDHASLFGRFVIEPIKDGGVLMHFATQDVKRKQGLVHQLGGSIVKPRRRVGDLWLAIVRDPSGNLIGLWETA